MNYPWWLLLSKSVIVTLLFWDKSRQNSSKVWYLRFKKLVVDTFMLFGTIWLLSMEIILTLLMYSICIRWWWCPFRRRRWGNMVFMIWKPDCLVREHEMLDWIKELRVISDQEPLLLGLLFHYKSFVLRLSFSRECEHFWCNRRGRERWCLPKEIVFWNIAPWYQLLDLIPCQLSCPAN